MRKMQLGLMAASAMLAAGACHASVLESELHYARRLRDKTNLITMVDQLAIGRSGDAAIKSFAAGDMADVKTDEQALFAKAVALQMPGVAMGPGAPGGGGGPPPGAGPGGPPGRGRGNGPGAANALVMAALKKLPDDAFDKAYLDEVIVISEDVERNVLGEISLPGANSDLAAFSKTYVITWAKNAAAAQRLLSGQPNPYGAPAGGPGPGAATFDKNGYYAGVLPAGELFGTVIK